MTLFSRLKSWWLGEPVILDHVAIRDSVLDWRDSAVLKAAEKHGRPFKCAADTVKREVLVNSTVIALEPGEHARHCNVVPLRRKS